MHSCPHQIETSGSYLRRLSTERWLIRQVIWPIDNDTIGCFTVHFFSPFFCSTFHSTLSKLEEKLKMKLDKKRKKVTDRGSTHDLSSNFCPTYLDSNLAPTSSFGLVQTCTNMLDAPPRSCSSHPRLIIFAHAHPTIPLSSATWIL